MGSWFQVNARPYANVCRLMKAGLLIPISNCMISMDFTGQSPACRLTKTDS